MYDLRPDVLSRIVVMQHGGSRYSRIGGPCGRGRRDRNGMIGYVSFSVALTKEGELKFLSA